MVSSKERQLRQRKGRKTKKLLQYTKGFTKESGPSMDSLGSRIVGRSGTRLGQFSSSVEDLDIEAAPPDALPHSRIIPAAVKPVVWQRDKGQCMICGATD